MSSLKDLYRAEIAKKQLAREAACASFEEAKARLAGLYRSITADRELMDQIMAEVELLDDDLRIDNGPMMIVVTALQDGGFRMEYELKRPDDYQSTPVPVEGIEDVERAIAKLLAEHRRED